MSRRRRPRPGPAADALAGLIALARSLPGPCRSAVLAALHALADAHAAETARLVRQARTLRREARAARAEARGWADAACQAEVDAEETARVLDVLAGGFRGSVN